MTETGNAENPAATESAYGTALEEVFIAERGTPFLLSSKDWQLIASWRDAGIPVDTVIRAVRETFDKKRLRGVTSKVSSISYCANAVEERWELERRGLVGTAAPAAATEGGSPAERLARVVERLETVSTGHSGKARTAFEKALAKLRALEPSTSFDALEEELVAIEGSLLKALAKTLDPAAREALAVGVAQDLGSPQGLAGTAVERMRRLLEMRRVRQLFALPPLTLFDV